MMPDKKDISDMRIKSFFTAACCVSAIFLSALNASGTEYADEISVPGGTVGSTDELYEALGGDESANIDESGIITLIRDIHLAESVTFREGSYELRGAGCIITSDSSAFVLESGAELTVGIEGDLGSEPSLSLVGSDKCGESLVVIGSGAKATFNSGVIFSGGKAEYGGSVFINGGEFILNGGSISDSEASRGGGVYMSGGTFTFLGGTVYGCRASCGAGLYAEAGSFVFHGGCIGKHSSIEPDGSKLEYGEKNAAESGGGIYISQEAEALLRGGEISENDGSGIYVSEGGTVELSGTVITENTAGRGGGIYNCGTVRAEKSNVSNNKADIGGGVWNSGEYIISGGQYSDNTAELRGGGIYNEGTLVLSQGSVVRNTAAAGGGIYNTGSFDFKGGTVGHCKLSTDGVGDAVMNSGDMSMSGTAYVYDDNTVALEIVSGNVSAINVAEEFNGADIMMTLETVSKTTGIDGIESYRRVSCVGLKVLRGDPALVASASGHVSVLINGRSYEIDESGTVKGELSVLLVVSISLVFVIIVSAAVAFVIFVKKKHSVNSKPLPETGISDSTEKEDRKKNER